MFSLRRSLVILALAAFIAGCNDGRHEPSEKVMQELVLPRIAEFFAPRFAADVETDDKLEAMAAYQERIPAYRAARVLEFRKVGCDKMKDYYLCEFYFQADAGGKLGVISVQDKVPIGYRDGQWVAGSARHQ
jgi:hypothetical protein